MTHNLASPEVLCGPYGTLGNQFSQGTDFPKLTSIFSAIIGRPLYQPNKRLRRKGTIVIDKSDSAFLR